jgi:hypothetical protein
MKFNELVTLAKDNGIYAGDIEFGPDEEFIGFVYIKSNKFSDSEELSNHFAVPINAEQ